MPYQAPLPVAAEIADTLQPHVGEFVTREINTEHGPRRYKIYIPTGYRQSVASPLVVMLHGCTQDPDDFSRGTRMNALAEERTLLVVYPEQPDLANPRKCWNWYDSSHQARDSGEPALLASTTRRVMMDYKVDAGRVYIAGVSAGAAMALVVALSYPELYAAVGTHSGIAFGAASNVTEALGAMQHGGHPSALDAKAALARPMPAIVFQGGSDQVVRSVNAGQITAQLAAAPNQNEAGSMQPSATPTNTLRGQSAGGYHYTRTVHGSGDAIVEMWMVDELGHAWSGGSTDGTFTDAKGPDASREMIRFFLEHQRGNDGKARE
ncbi:MAG: extracellular catalytic domain type 1 short-chain-length polyhydroxyalkanoate depolymerase [Gemmatimonadaceae bacterium]